MYFSHIVLQEDAKSSSDFWQIFRNPYALHQAVWRLFGDHAERKRDFLYRLDGNGRKPLIYAVSARLPEARNGLWHIESKVYEPKIMMGVRLAFMLRANPVLTKRDEDNKQHRHDVIMETKTNLKKQGDVKSLAVLVQQEGSRWLSERAGKHGFNIGEIRADGYQQHRFFKGNKPVSLSTVEFNGVLTVTNAEQFVESLYKGIGPAKGFGCGLMMVKRV